jgi:hypothetical protein
LHASYLRAHVIAVMRSTQITVAASVRAGHVLPAMKHAAEELRTQQQQQQQPVGQQPAAEPGGSPPPSVRQAMRSLSLALAEDDSAVRVDALQQAAVKVRRPC